MINVSGVNKLNPGVNERYYLGRILSDLLDRPWTRVLKTHSDSTSRPSLRPQVNDVLQHKPDAGRQLLVLAKSCKKDSGGGDGELMEEVIEELRIDESAISYYPFSIMSIPLILS